jgi:hypothetical protein
MWKTWSHVPTGSNSQMKKTHFLKEYILWNI